MLARKHLNSSPSASAGLTMIEVAIVFLIISALLGAILGAKEIIRTTRLKKIATEVQSFGVAARSFEQKYDALPGDYDDAGSTIAGCETDGAGNPANPNFCRNGNGDGRVGAFCYFNWRACGQTGPSPISIDGSGATVPSEPAAITNETNLFWKHLLLTGFITGVINVRADPMVPRWRESHPESAVWDSGYVASSQSGFIGGSVNINFIPTPEYYGKPASFSGAANGLRSLSVIDGIYLDSKYDNAVSIDNIPNSPYTGAGSGAIWWGPVGSADTDCRTDDSRGVTDAWVVRNKDFLNKKNCVFNWTVF